LLVKQASTLVKNSGRAGTQGDVLATLRIAGIQAAKKTVDLIPLCSPADA